MSKNEELTSVFLMKNGPLRIIGKFKFVDEEGNESIEDEKVAFCRCGHTGKKPFCDGTHKRLEGDENQLKDSTDN